MRLLYSWQESPSAQTPCTEKTVDTHKNTVPITSCQSQSPFLGSGVKFSWAIGRPTQRGVMTLKKDVLFYSDAEFEEFKWDKLWKCLALRSEMLRSYLLLAPLTEWEKYRGSIPVTTITNQPFSAALSRQAEHDSWGNAPGLHLRRQRGIWHCRFKWGDVADGYQGEGRKTTRFPQLCSILGSHYREMSFQ